MKFQGILLCTDLDGTLIGDDERISEENRRAIEYFQREGGSFTFVTGRASHATRALISAIRPNVPIGCLNGGGIYDGEQDKMLWAAYLDREVDAMLDAVEAAMPDMGIIVNAPGGVFFTNETPSNADYCRRRGIHIPVRPRSEIGHPYYKIVFLHCDEARIEQLVSLLASHPLADRYSYIRSEKELYEILPKGVSKGDVLLRLADQLGIERSHTIAVGDYNNDISMIRSAGVGYAVANAIAEVKAAADRITVSNNEGAIAAIVRDLDEGRIFFL